MKARKGMGGSGYARAKFTEDLMKDSVKTGDMIVLRVLSESKHALYIDQDPNDLHKHWMLMSGEESPRARDGTTCDFVKVGARLKDAKG